MTSEYRNDENSFEPPCPMAKQCIGGGFAFFFSFAAMMLFHSHFFTMFALALGAAWGTLAADKSLPTEINLKEFGVLLSVSLICCCILNLIFEADNILGLLISSFLCSSFASAIHLALIATGQLLVDPKIARVCRV